MWNVLAPIYDSTIGLGLNSDMAIIRSLIPWKQDYRVLDIGGGTGRIAKHLQPFVKNVIVADSSKKMLARAARKGLNIQWLNSAYLPFDDDSFDVVTIIEALHHFPQQAATLQQCQRVLRPGGCLIIEEPNPASVLKYGLWIERLFDTVNYHTPVALSVLLENIGFTVTKKQLERLMYFTVAAKK